MEPNYTYGVRIPDTMRLDLGAIIVERFMGHRDGFVKEECTEWLKQVGFNQVEWLANEEGDILLLLLWRAGTVEQDSGRLYGGSMVDEFILEFAGHDELVVSLFNFMRERVVV